MQTTYALNSPKAIHGLALIAPERTRPMTLPPSFEVQLLTIPGGAGTTDMVITVLDRKSSVSYSVTATGSATEATALANALAALRAHAKLNQLFTFADGGTGADVVISFTAKHAGQLYTISSTGGPGNTAASGVVSTAANAAGLTPGQLVVYGTNDGEFAAMSSSTTVRDIAGFLDRRDANIFHSLENDSPSAVDTVLRGKTHPIAQEGEFWVTVQEAVTPASRPHVRVEGTSVGDWGDSPAGTAQTLTVTPIVNMAIYGFAFGATVNGRRYEIEATYMPTDATTSIADACAGLFDAVTADITAKGLTSFLTPTDNATTLTIAAAAGIVVDEPSVRVWYADAEAATATATVSSADADMLDVSSIARYMSTAAAGSLARVRIDITS